MADSSLIDIFDLCVERLAAGDTVEDCLRDYPEHASELRSMLETGLLIFQAQDNAQETQQAQAHTRTRIEEALHQEFSPRKGKKTMPTFGRTIFIISGAAAAVFAFTFGFAFATTPATPQYTTVAQMSDWDLRLTATQYILEATQTALGVDTDRDNLDDTREAALGTDPHLADTDQDGVSDGEEVRLWNSNPLQPDTDNDGVSDGEEINRRGTNPLVAELGSTATALPTLIPPSTGLEAETPVVTLLAAHADSSSAALPTEAARDGTAADEAEAASGVEVPLTAGISDGSLALSAPASADKPAQEDADVLNTLKDDRGLPGNEEPLTMVIYPYPTVTMIPVLMNAGEIDDNAQWDAYTELRRNFLNDYAPQSIIDLDVTGRRIIKVVDTMGQPILGAHVEVFMDQTRVSDTTTYATGMTLFFPNAQEQTRRRDTFTVTVTVDQVQVTQAINLSRVGDVIEVKMPVVIVRDALSPAAANALAADQNATLAAQKANEAFQNATTLAVQDATLAAQNASRDATPLSTLSPTPIVR